MGEVKSAFEMRELPCGVCGSRSSKLLGWRGGSAHHGGVGERIQIVRCRECSHLYPNPMPFPAENLDQLYTDTEHYFDGHDIERLKQYGLGVLRESEARLGRRGRYLDVGCGMGGSLWAAREEGWEYEGVDPSSDYLKWARENLGVEGRQGTIEEMRFPESHFDVVTMIGVIEHLYEPFATLQEIWRVLSPGGLLWLDAPNEDALYMRVGNLYMRTRGRDWVINLAPTFPPYHVQGFNRRSLPRLLKRVGFEIEKMRVWGNMWPFTGKPSLRKQIEYRGAQLVNWVGNRSGTGLYMTVLARKPEA